ncbi:MAG TPA: class I SAM-dependent methyltransferase [Polyangiales bacterium]
MAIQLAQEAQEEVPCPGCGEDKPQLVMWARDRLFGRPGSYRIVRCESCGLGYLSPRPTLQSLGLHYPDDYFIYKKPEEESPLVRPFTQWLDNAHWLTAIRRIEKVIGPIKPGLSIVDVGCGLNRLLSTVKKERGVEGVGVDFKPEVAAYVRDVLKMKVVQGTLHDGHFADASVDLVTMNEYLEHEPFPRQVLAEARRITRPGGHLWIEVPRTDCWAARVFGSRWSQVDAPRHLLHFTPATLTQLLERSGYKVVQIGDFRISLLIGLSVMQSLGARHLGNLGLVDSALAFLGALPLQLAYPWLDEFMYVCARAE